LIVSRPSSGTFYRTWCVRSDVHHWRMMCVERSGFVPSPFLIFGYSVSVPRGRWLWLSG